MGTNPDCDNVKCLTSTGEVRMYPLGGDAWMHLCRYCWDYENRYRARRARQTGNPDDWPQPKWETATVYRLGR